MGFHTMQFMGPLVCPLPTGQHYCQTGVVVDIDTTMQNELIISSTGWKHFCGHFACQLARIEAAPDSPDQHRSGDWLQHVDNLGSMSIITTH